MVIVMRCAAHWAVVIALILLGMTCGLNAEQTSSSQAADSVAAGAALFSGKVRFVNNGPSCIACHSAGGLSFPNGGTLGPDLTHAYTRMGPEGIKSILRTLYFPAMYPLYKRHPLTHDEQTKLAAFLKYSSTQSSPATTWPVIGIAGVLFVIFMLIIGFCWRNRLQSTREKLVASARARVRARTSAKLESSVASPPDATEGDLM